MVRNPLSLKQKKMLALTFSQLKQIYNQEIPEVVEIADKSSSVEEFKAGMLRFLEICRIENEAAEEAREQIRDRRIFLTSPL